jgi:hypothetical protein
MIRRPKKKRLQKREKSVISEEKDCSPCRAAEEDGRAVLQEGIENSHV